MKRSDLKKLSTYLPDTNSSKLVKIGDASKLLGVSIDTLRRWEKKGWLRAIKTPGGTRLYDKDQLEKLNPNLKRGPKSLLSPLLKNPESATQPYQTLSNNSVPSISLSSDRPILQSTDHLSLDTRMYDFDKDISDEFTASQDSIASGLNRSFKHIRSNLTALIIMVIAFSSLLLPIYLLSNYFKGDQKISTLTQKLNNNPLIIASDMGKLITSVFSPVTSKRLFGNYRSDSPPGEFTEKLNANDNPAQRRDLGFINGVKNLGLSGEVLAQSSPSASFIEINIDTKINGTASISGNLTAPNILYGLTAGEGITITGDAQSPTIGTSLIETLATVTARGASTTTALTLTGGATLGASLNLGQLSADPSSAVNGATYYSTSSNKFRCYINGSWANCDTDTDTDTNAGGDVTAVTVGNGLTGGGASGALTIDLDVTTSSTTTTTTSNSGLEVASDGLSLLRGCANTEILSWDSTNVYWECSTVSAAGGMTSFSLAGDSGTSQTITDSNTLSVSGGTNGIDTSAGATDTVTLNLDTTEIGTTTFGSGSGITWTFDAGATDPTLVFASDQITLGAATAVFSGTTTITASSLTLFTGGATAIDFSEFDVAAATGSITINDGGDAGQISVEGTVLDINSLDFTGAGTLTSGATTNLTFTPGSTGDLVFSTDSDTTATFSGSAEGTANVILTAGDLTLTDGDININSGELVVDSDATGQSASAAKAINITSTGSFTTAGGNITNYSGYFSNTSTESAGSNTLTNIGLYATASGADTNYAAIFEAGNVGIGDTSPSAPLEVGNGTDSLQVSSVGDITFVDTDGGASITGPAGGALSISAANSQALALSTTTAGDITLTTAAATGLANVLTGNLKVGNGTPGVTLDGEDAYIEGTLEVDGAVNLAGTITTALTASRFVVSDASSNLATTGTSAFLISTLSDETGSGVAVFGTSPEITTSITTGSTSFDVFNTTATTVNAFGAATTLELGAATGTTSVNNDLTVDGNTTLGNSNTADTLTGTLLTSAFTSGATTQTVFAVSSTTLTTGELLDITGTYAPTDGSTNEAIDINITHSPTTSADNFQSINLTTTDGTALANTVYNLQGTLTLTGNAAKTGIGDYQTVTSSSTTGDTLIAFDAASTVTGIIGGATTRSVYGLRSQPTAGAESTAGTTNVYGAYLNATGDVGVGGTFNAYGAYIANGTYDTDGTSTAYGLYVEDISGADTNIDLNFTGSPIVRIGDAGVLTFTEAGGNNTLCTITDSSNVGNLSCTGNITGSSSGTVGFWSRSSTTLSPATANDIVSIANTTTSGADLAVTNTGVYTGTGLVAVTANSASTGDLLTVSGTALTSGSLLTLTGPSGGTAGVTDAGFKITSDVGNIGTSNGLISSTATFDGSSATGVNLYLTSSDAIASANTDYGIYNTISNTGALDSAATKTSYGSYTSVSSTGGAPTTAGTTTVYGQYITTTATHAANLGTVNNYGLYVANGTSSTNGTSSKYGIYVEEPTGADTNYGIYSAGRIINNGAGAAIDDSAFMSLNPFRTTTATDNYGLYVQQYARQALTNNIGASFGTSSGSGAYTITNGISLEVRNSSKGTGITLTNGMALQVGAQTGGTNNAGVLIGEATGTNQSNLVIGQTTIPTGTFSIYNVSTDQNYFAGNTGIGDDTSPDALLEVSSSDTDGGDFLITNTGTGTSGTVASIVSNSTTTGDILTISSTALTTGTAIKVTGSTSAGLTGSTSGLLNLTSDVGNATAGQLAYFAPDFSSGTGVVGYGLRVIGTDATTVGNNDYAVYGEVTSSGNANKDIFGIAGHAVTSSTTADRTFGGNFSTSVTGANSTGTRNSFGVRALPVSTADNTGGGNTLYGIYSAPSATGAGATSGTPTTEAYGAYLSTTATHGGDRGTVNQYGAYIANGTSSTNGTSTKYGLYIEDQSGADTNIDLNFTASPTVRIGDAGVLTFTEAGGNNTLCTITDSSNVGNLNCTGVITQNSTAVATGTGSTNVLTKWSNTSGLLTDSSVSDDGTTVTVAANKNFALASGTGTFAQTYSGTGSNIHNVDVTGTASSGTQEFINFNITNSLSGTASFLVGTDVKYLNNSSITATDYASRIYVDSSSGTDNVNALLRIENVDADQTVVDAISIASTTDSLITNAVNASDAEIANAFYAGANFMRFDGIRVFEGSTGTLTVEDTSGNDLCTITDAGTTGNLSCTGNVTGSSSGTVGFWSRSSTTLSPATANDIVSIANTTTSGADLAITNTGVYTGTGIFNLTANSATTGDILTISATGLTTGTALTLTGSSSTGVTDHFVKVTADVGSDSSLVNLNPDFSGSAVTGYGVYNLATDATANANTDYGYYGSLALTGNAAKVGIGDYQTVTSSSTTGDTLVAFDAATTVSGILAGATTRSVYGLRSQPTAGAESAAGTTNLYGIYSKATGDVAASGTINTYGAYIADGGGDAEGTATNYGLYLETISGADTNYSIYSAGGTNYLAGNTGIGGITPVRTISAYGSSDGSISFHTSTTGTTQTDGLYVGVNGSTAYIWNYETSTLGFATSNAQQLSIDSNGDITIAAGNNLSFASGAGTYTQTFTGTTTDAFTITASSITSGTALTLTGSSSTGVTDHFVKVTADVGSDSSLVNLNPDFSGSAVTGYGVYNLATDATANANTDYGYYGSLALTGNADKTGVGIYSTVTSSSTSADTLVALDLATSVTGIIAAGTAVRDVYGLRSQPSAGAESTADTTNVYGVYSKVAADVGAGGTVNGYGLYVANGTFDTDGTSTQYGLYVESPTGADTNYAGVFAGGNVGIGDISPSVALEIASATSSDQVRFTAPNPTLSLASSDDVTDRFPAFKFQNSSYTTKYQFVADIGGTPQLYLDIPAGALNIRDTLNGGTTILQVAQTGVITATGNINANGGLDIDDVFVVADGGAVTANTDVDFVFAGSEDFNISSTATTANVAGLASTTLTTGEILDITSTHAPADGSTNEAIDINITHTPTVSADNFQSINLTTTDGTALGNTVYNFQGTLTLTGNAAKTGIGDYQTVTSSSTTGDTLVAFDAATTVSGILAGATTRSVYGLRSQPTAGAESGAGTTNLYGVYSKATGDVAASGTINTYGVYVADGAGDAEGTATNFGLYLEPITGADTNYGICFDCDGTYGTSSIATGISWGSDANTVTLYRSASDVLRTGDGLTVDLDLIVSGGDITGANSAAIDLGEATTGTLTFTAGSTGDFVFTLDSDSNTQFTATSPGVDTVVMNAGTSTTDGVDALQLTFTASDASGNVIDITPSVSVSASDTFNVIDIDAFTGTIDAAGTLTLNALNIGNLTQSETTGTIAPTAIKIGTGWDASINTALSAAAQALVIDAATTDNTNASGIIQLTLDSTASQKAIDLSIETITDTAADTLSGLAITAAQTSTDDDVIYGIVVNDLTGTPDAGNEYAIYQSGTSWDYGLYIEDAALLNTTLAVNGNTTIGNANSDTLTINAGTSGTGITIADATFATCTALETVANVLTCGSDAGGATAWSDISAPTGSLSLTFEDTGTAETTTFTSNANTETFFTFTGASFTTGELLDLTGTFAPADGSTNEAIDINITHTPTSSADNFRSIDLDTSDGTALGSTIYNLDATLTLTGNAAKTGIGAFSAVTSSSTTGDTLAAFDASTTVSGILAGATTRSVYGLRSQPTAGAESAAGTTNLYGVYSKAAGDVAVGGTINTYGLYVADGGGDAEGTATNFGLYLEPITGADTNYGICFDCDGTYGTSSIATGISWGSDANTVTLYRSASDVLRTNDGLTVDLDLIVSGGDITGANSDAIDIGEAANDEIQFTLGGAVEYQFALDSGNPALQITDGETFKIEDASGNDLVTLADAGTTGNMSVSGTFNANSGFYVITALTYAKNDVATSNDQGRHTSVKAIDSNTAVVAYYDVTGGDLETSKTTNGGSTWAQVTAQSTNVVGQWAALDIVDSNTYHVAMYQQTDGDSHHVKSTDGGATWSSGVDIDISGGVLTEIDAVNSNTIYVSYVDKTSTSDTAPGTGQSRVARSTDGGATWGNTAVNVTNSAGWNDIKAIDANTAYFVAHTDDGTGGNDCAWKKTTDGGGTWSVMTDIDTQGCEYVSMDATDSNTIYVAYQDRANDDLEVAKSTDGGGTFTVTNVDTVALATGLWTDIDAYDSNTVIVTYQDGTNGDLKMAKTTSGGSSWTVNTLDDTPNSGTSTTTGAHTGISAVDGNTYFITYYDESGADAQSYSRSSSGTAVGIGTSTPTYKLGVSGTVAATNGFVTGGPDIAENYYSDDSDIEAGDVVAADRNGKVAHVKKATSGYQGNVLGIISTNPGFIATGRDDFLTDGVTSKENERLVALAGRVPVKITDENGPVYTGDYLTSSATLPGYAMKAVRPGQTVGKALEDFDPASTSQSQSCQENPSIKCGKIMTFVNTSFADPQNALANLLFDDDGSLIVPKIKTSSLLVDANIAIDPLEATGSGSLDNSGLLASGNSATGSGSQSQSSNFIDVASKLTTIDNLIATQSARLAEIEQISNNAVAQTLSLSDKVASTSANLSWLSSQIDSLLSGSTPQASDSGALDLTPPDILIATGSAQLADLSVSNKISTLDLESTGVATFSGVLKSFGETFLGQTTIAGDLTADGTFSISNGSAINAFPTLYLQTSALAEKIDLFNGLVTIDKSGNIVTNTISASEFKTIANTTSGSGKIISGDTQVIIPNTYVKPNSRILITPTSSTNMVLAVTDKIAGQSFTASILVPASTDLSFDWWIINETSP